jgi:hypothetical protein
VQSLGTVERRRMGGRKPRAAAPEPDPAQVPTTRATVIDAEPLGREAPAEAWLRSAGAEEAAAFLAVLNRLVHAHRIAAADPAVHEVSLEQALVIRLGFGVGEAVAEGRWRMANEIPAERSRRRRRAALLRPQERVAKLFGGRVAELRAEELALRAREDLDGERAGLCALSLAEALAGVSEEVEPKAALAARLAELEGLRPQVEEAARAVREGSGEIDERAVRHALERLEALLRARVVAQG